MEDIFIRVIKSVIFGVVIELNLVQCEYIINHHIKTSSRETGQEYLEIINENLFKSLIKSVNDLSSTLIISISKFVHRNTTPSLLYKKG